MHSLYCMHRSTRFPGFYQKIKLERAGFSCFPVRIHNEERIHRRKNRSKLKKHERGVHMEAIVFGNVTLDIICYPVNEVPRYESIAFEDVTVSPGGCGSNTAIGLASLGVPTGIVARTGNDDSAELLFRYWQRVGVDPFYVQKTPGVPTGTSVGLIDDNYQPRFIHTSGANRGLTAEVIDPQAYSTRGVKFFHIAGFFVLPNLFSQVAEKLAQLQTLGITTSLDVVFNVRMDDRKLRDSLWASLPHLDYFMANDHEATRLTGESDYQNAAVVLRARGTRSVIIKLGAKGCFALSDDFTGIVPATKVNVVDTTGAGDAFAAGFIAGLTQGCELRDACQRGNRAGAKVCTRLGAIASWLDTP
jgi:sugar/nucleoside kinase (ribokinase family)